MSARQEISTPIPGWRGHSWLQRRDSELSRNLHAEIRLGASSPVWYVDQRRPWAGRADYRKPASESDRGSAETNLGAAGGAPAPRNRPAILLRGESPDGIAESFPALELEQVFGALAFYMANRDMVDRYLSDGRSEFEAMRQQARRNNPSLYAKLDEARRDCNPVPASSSYPRASKSAPPSRNCS